MCTDRFGAAETAFLHAGSGRLRFLCTNPLRWWLCSEVPPPLFLPPTMPMPQYSPSGHHLLVATLASHHWGHRTPQAWALSALTHHEGSKVGTGQLHISAWHAAAGQPATYLCQVPPQPGALQPSLLQSCRLSSVPSSPPPKAKFFAVPPPEKSVARFTSDLVRASIYPDRTHLSRPEIGHLVRNLNYIRCYCYKKELLTTKSVMHLQY